MTFDPAFGQVFDAETGTFEPRSPLKTVMDVAGHFPGFAESMGATGFRGSQTILRGGWGDAIGKQAAAPKTGGMLRNNNPLRPRTWTRYGSQDLFFGGKGTYSPVQVLSGGGNWLAKQGLLGSKIKGASGGPAGAFGRGFVSQATAAERIGMSGVGKAPGLASYFSKAGMSVPAEVLANPTSARTAMYASVRGGVTGRAAGYMAGLRDPFAVVNAAKALGQTSAEVSGLAFGRGAAKAATHLGLGGIKAGASGLEVAATGAKVGRIGARAGVAGAKTAFTGAKGAFAGVRAMGAFGGAFAAAQASPLMPVVNTIMLAMLVADVGKMAGAAIQGIPRLAVDAGRSFTGGNNRQGFGVPFKTNELAFTSRARGVQAIQNSRLNSRSALGSEASGMANYFG